MIILFQDISFYITIIAIYTITLGIASNKAF